MLDFSVGVGYFVIGLSQISFFFSKFGTFLGTTILLLLETTYKRKLELDIGAT